MKNEYSWKPSRDGQYGPSVGPSERASGQLCFKADDVSTNVSRHDLLCCFVFESKTCFIVFTRQLDTGHRALTTTVHHRPFERAWCVFVVSTCCCCCLIKTSNGHLLLSNKLKPTDQSVDTDQSGMAPVAFRSRAAVRKEMFQSSQTHKIIAGGRRGEAIHDRLGNKKKSWGNEQK